MTQSNANVQTAEQFLKISNRFKLGCLQTQQQNPKTIDLSNLSQTSLDKAIQLIKELDMDTLNILNGKISQIELMYRDINECMSNGGRVFICGCGATGRLSLVLETVWRRQAQDLFKSGLVSKEQYGEWKDRVISFMAGGDAALIKSIEDFEDHPQFAEAQLRELGFTQNDLLIGSTQGGETSWVIGAIWQSTRISKYKPYILYGNTDQILIQNVERSREFIQSDKIKKINCNVGHMALAGSTRMQSTTILMYAIGLALYGCDWMRKHRTQLAWTHYAQDNLTSFMKYFKQLDMCVIKPLIEYQTNVYKKQQSVTYHADPFLAISILTDTTERAPTFSLNPFPNRYNPESLTKKCWCNMKIIHQQQPNLPSEDQITNRDWQEMLGGREIRGLNSNYWLKYETKVSNRIISGFSLHNSNNEKVIITSYPLTIRIPTAQPQINVIFPTFKTQPNKLSQHILLKIILNNLSTLIMGRMDRYSSNIMTYVRPTNYKLIDRATRYVRTLLNNYNLQCSYEEVVKVIYEIKNKIKQDQPIVLKAIDFIKTNNLAQPYLLNQFLTQKPHTSFYLPNRDKTQPNRITNLQKLQIKQYLQILKIIAQGIHHLHQHQYSMKTYKDKNYFLESISYINDKKIQCSLKQKLILKKEQDEKQIVKPKQGEKQVQKPKQSEKYILQIKQYQKYIFTPYNIVKANQETKKSEMRWYGLMCLWLIYKIQNIESSEKVCIKLKQYSHQKLLINVIQQCLSFQNKNQPSAFKIISILTQIINAFQIKNQPQQKKNQQNQNQQYNKQLSKLNHFYCVFDSAINKSKYHIKQYDYSYKQFIQKAIGQDFLVKINASKEK